MPKYSKRKIEKMFTAHQKYLERRRLQRDREALLNDERTPIARRIAQNLDQLMVVASIHEPDFSPGLVDRFLVLASIENINPLVCITKADLIKDDQNNFWKSFYTILGIPVIITSVILNTGIDEVKEFLEGRKTALAGHSGVGKSALLNAINPSLQIKTGAVNIITGRGRHITKTVRLYILNEKTEVFDLPGIKLIDFPDLKPSDIADHFPDFKLFDEPCRFSDCSHLREPGCAVKKAVNEGKFEKMRYESYLRITEELNG